MIAANGAGAEGPAGFGLDSLSMLDAAAIALVVIGVLCHLGRRRLGDGAGGLLFAGLTTAGIAMAVLGRHTEQADLLSRASQAAAALAALWSLLAWMNSGRPDRASKRPLPAPSRAFFVWALGCGTAAVTLVLQNLIRATGLRLLDPDAAFQQLSSEGLIDLLAVMLAALFWTATVSRPRQPVVLLLLTALMVWWSSLMIPAGELATGFIGSRSSGSAGRWHDLRPAWWTWTFHLQCGLAVALMGAALIQESRYRRRRNLAWPGELDNLLEPYPRWPAYIQAEAVIAAAVLILGVYQIVTPHHGSLPLGLANFILSMAAGLTCLFMTYRRWSGNTAGLGVALSSLGLVALACLIATLLVPQDSRTEYARRISILDNAVLFALAVAVAYWSWLTGFWEQQLLNGRPWTTAGRMIPFADRAAFLLSALAVLVAFRMALWPRQVLVVVEDNTPGRMVVGLVAILLLSGITGRKAKRCDSSAEATLAVAFLIAAMAFVFVRIQPSQRQQWGWLIQYEAVVLSAACLPILVVAEALYRTRWRSFSGPLWLLALFIIPLRVLILLLPSNRLPAEWLRPGTLAILGTLYSLAGSRENRRAILVLGIVLLVAALTTFYRSYGKVIM